MSWQRTNIQAAATYLRERIATDARAKVVHEGLLDVLDPSRRTVRMQLEMAAAAKAAVPVTAARERRTQIERRHTDRRRANHGPPNGIERRAGHDRRTGRDRRNGR